MGNRVTERRQWVIKTLNALGLDRYRSLGVWFIFYDGREFRCKTTGEAEMLLEGLLIANQYKMKLAKSTIDPDVLN